MGDWGCLLWSDIPNHRVLRWSEDDGHVSVYQTESGYSNGHTRDNQGRLVACEQDTRRVRRREYDGMWTVLADNYQGKKLNAPNDAAVHADGSVYNTKAAILSNVTNGPVRRHKTEIRGCLSTSFPPELWITRRRPRPLARAPSSRCKRAETLRMEARTKHARVAAGRPAWTTNMG
jgi:SMP-30/gluconolaconase/LRE-like protein